MLLKGFLHLPKILFAAVSYVVALYVDCRRVSPKLTLGEFLPAVAWAFLRVIPVYPFLAVLISFVFLFVIAIVEGLGLPEDWLNWPIYYGTLYGPFSYVYWRVKHSDIRSVLKLKVISLNNRNVFNVLAWHRGTSLCLCTAP